MKKKTPQKDHTRSDGLPVSLQRLLILVCEDTGLAEADAAQVVDSNSAFGGKGTDLRTRCRRKVRYYRKLRSEDPEAYW